jgi:hypothetical protein
LIFNPLAYSKAFLKRKTAINAPLKLYAATLNYTHEKFNSTIAKDHQLRTQGMGVNNQQFHPKLFHHLVCFILFYNLQACIEASCCTLRPHRAN